MPKRIIEIKGVVSSNSPLKNGIDCNFSATLTLNAEANINYDNHNVTSHVENYSGEATLAYDATIINAQFEKIVPASMVRIPMNGNIRGHVNFNTNMTYEISYDMPIGDIFTDKNNACWAVSLSFLKTWKENNTNLLTNPLADVLEIAGERFKTIFREDTGNPMSDPEWEMLLERFGLVNVAENKLFTPCELFNLLRNYGPLLVAYITSVKTKTNVLSRNMQGNFKVSAPETNVMHHWVVITGIVDDGTLKNSKIYYISPGPGSTSGTAGLMSYTDFRQRFAEKFSEIPDGLALNNELEIKYRFLHFQNKVQSPPKVKAQGEGNGRFSYAGRVDSNPFGFTPMARVDFHINDINLAQVIVVGAKIESDGKVTFGMPSISDPTVFMGEAKEQQ
jgi:hypothetical protein